MFPNPNETSVIALMVFYGDVVFYLEHVVTIQLFPTFLVCPLVLLAL